MYTTVLTDLSHFKILGTYQDRDYPQKGHLKPGGKSMISVKLIKKNLSDIFVVWRMLKSITMTKEKWNKN